MKSNKARKYESKILNNILNGMTKEEHEKTRKQMELAVLIWDGMTKKGLSKIQFAKEMNVQPSIVTRWLSGTHNFTINTLIDIEFLLNIKLLNV